MTHTPSAVWKVGNEGKGTVDTCLGTWPRGEEAKKGGVSGHFNFVYFATLFD